MAWGAPRTHCDSFRVPIGDAPNFMKVWIIQLPLLLRFAQANAPTKALGLASGFVKI